MVKLYYDLVDVVKLYIAVNMVRVACRVACVVFLEKNMCYLIHTYVCKNTSSNSKISVLQQLHPLIDLTLFFFALFFDRPSL